MSVECASIPARPALGLEACLELTRTSASGRAGLGAARPGRNQESTLEAILPGLPERFAGVSVARMSGGQRDQKGLIVVRVNGEGGGVPVAW